MSESCWEGISNKSLECGISFPLRKECGKSNKSIGHLERFRLRNGAKLQDIDMRQNMFKNSSFSARRSFFTKYFSQPTNLVGPEKIHPVPFFGFEKRSDISGSVFHKQPKNGVPFGRGKKSFCFFFLSSFPFSLSLSLRLSSASGGWPCIFLIFLSVVLALLSVCIYSTSFSIGIRCHDLSVLHPSTRVFTTTHIYFRLLSHTCYLIPWRDRCQNKTVL